MKMLTTSKVLIPAAIVCLFAACKKDKADTPAFTASVNNQAYTFDSLFAVIDTGAASLGRYYVSVGAKDIKTGNLVYMQGVTAPAPGYNGTYFFIDPLPSPVPASYRWLNGVSIILNTGQNTGSFNLGGSNISNFSVDKTEDGVVEGNYSFTLHPVANNGTTDASISIPITGHFNVPYHFIP